MEKEVENVNRGGGRETPNAHVVAAHSVVAVCALFPHRTLLELVGDMHRLSVLEP